MSQRLLPSSKANQAAPPEGVASEEFMPVRVMRFLFGLALLGAGAMHADASTPVASTQTAALKPPSAAPSRG
jgi:hypothetical protein